MASLTDKQVLITGGSGSIGSRLVELALEHDPAAVRVFDNDEAGLFALKREHPEHEETLRFLLGDVRDRRRLEMATDGIDVVFHAAALKHVEMNEYNPFEAVQTNVQGTQNLIREALESEVEAFVGISTDKASNPTTVMGATKLLAERLITAANTYKGGKDTDFGCVRFGNVLGSSGSVVPIFTEQARSGGPITVTDPDMTRFLMSTAEAAEFVFEAYDRLEGGEVFVKKMPAFRLAELAELIRDEVEPVDGASGAVDIEVIGPRPGERTHEKLLSVDEMRHVAERDEMFILYPQIDVPGYSRPSDPDRPDVGEEYTSADARMLTRDELLGLLRSADETEVSHD